jgi:hypothetical protein
LWHHHRDADLTEATIQAKGDKTLCAFASSA